MPSVLIVDDDPVSRMLLSHMLRSSGHEVTEAADGNEALATIGAGAFDLVISDEEMPGKTGREVRTELGADFVTPFVLLTGTMLEPSEIDEAPGIVACLTKPVASMDLATLLDDVLPPSSAN